ncbi:hypothetical protein CWB99_10920 [Pseudoalteromonas rubra]|uniref:Uncharacterized protein n=1 Tax=Pseudoalteromonas rubra TaxID=43658 RepID=A0A5S3WLP9_9GAMM|nr:hypothetical protein [Pseudoalteromonas rubra]TMP28739.1 hypothetical protein CWB99_10920 [Pseudoalteromonas rubra]TMP28801.1 hypothetical protein CWC00_20770 [Pseudoalteromonas rubra]
MPEINLFTNEKVGENPRPGLILSGTKLNALQCGPQGKIQDVFCHPFFSAIAFKRTAFIGGFFYARKRIPHSCAHTIAFKRTAFIGGFFYA